MVCKGLEPICGRIVGSDESTELCPAPHAYAKLNWKQNYPLKLGGSPGLVVKGGDSLSKEHEFKSRRRIFEPRDLE